MSKVKLPVKNQIKKNILTEDEIDKATKEMEERCKALFDFIKAVEDANYSKSNKFIAKILNIIDASYGDNKQNEAIKGLIKGAHKEFIEKEREMEGVVQNRISQALYGNYGIQSVDLRTGDDGEPYYDINPYACGVFFPKLTTREEEKEMEKKYEK